MDADGRLDALWTELVEQEEERASRSEQARQRQAKRGRR